MSILGRSMLGLVAITTMFGGYIADWNETHIYNTRWPPHAKFHNGQTLSSGVLLGGSALYYILRPSWSAQELSPELQRESLHYITWLLSLNWIAQLSAALYPGSLPVDPEFGDGFPQLYICAGLFTIIAIGFGLTNRGLDTKKTKVHDK